jgi:hypothetical protein
MILGENVVFLGTLKDGSIDPFKIVKEIKVVGAHDGKRERELKNAVLSKLGFVPEIEEGWLLGGI